MIDAVLVSIPFIAGQWSLRWLAFGPWSWPASFQSPSLRGSGRFLAWGVRVSTNKTSFNPLHCGAVVASTPSVAQRAHPPTCFNPLHCGAVVASNAHSPHGGGGKEVSIPFIAGQWSLRGTGRNGMAPAHTFQSPSLRGSGRFRGKRMSNIIVGRFNPLHCGAVVASGITPPRRRGAWAFQSPSLRGSGRFETRRHRRRQRPRKVSIPFIAGQWSLPLNLHTDNLKTSVFQSPSLRGSGRFDKA